MGDVPIKPKPEPTREERVREALRDYAETGRSNATLFLTGTPRGRIRRPLLFIAVAVGIVFNWPVVALVALLLLAGTDQVVDLSQ